MNAVQMDSLKSELIIIGNELKALELAEQAGSQKTCCTLTPQQVRAEVLLSLLSSDMAENWRDCCVPFLGEAGSPSNTMWPGPRPIFVPSSILMHLAVRLQQTWDENWGRVVCPFRGKESGSPSNTMWHGPRFTSLPSSILIYPAVCPQRHGPKIGGMMCAPFGWRGAGSPSNTIWPQPRPIAPYQVAS